MYIYDPTIILHCFLFCKDVGIYTKYLLLKDKFQLRCSFLYLILIYLNKLLPSVRDVGPGNSVYLGSNNHSSLFPSLQRCWYLYQISPINYRTFNSDFHSCIFPSYIHVSKIMNRCNYLVST